MTFNEIPCGNGAIEVDAGGHRLVCPVCQNTTYHERDSLLHSRMSAFFRMDWATGDTAANYVCTRCGYIFWFLK
jgi:hypothetical protein